MTLISPRAETPVGPVSPLFVVADLMRAVAFYRDQLGFEVRLLTPAEDPFFAIVFRDAAQIFLKHVSDQVQPQPNPSRHAWAPWDAFVFTEDPDALAAELASRGVTLHAPVTDRDDGLRGLEVRDADGYVLFLGCPRP